MRRKLRYAQKEKTTDTYMLVRFLCAKREFSVVSTSNEHVVDLMIEQQRQRVRTAVTVRLPPTHHERTILNTHIIVVIIIIII